jgi:hypothetical protein
MTLLINAGSHQYSEATEIRIRGIDDRLLVKNLGRNKEKYLHCGSDGNSKTTTIALKLLKSLTRSVAKKSVS